MAQEAVSRHVIGQISHFLSPYWMKIKNSLTRTDAEVLIYSELLSHTIFHSKRSNRLENLFDQRLILKLILHIQTERTATYKAIELGGDVNDR